MTPAKTRQASGSARLRYATETLSIRAAGHRVTTIWIEADSATAPAEIRSAFELNRIQADRVRRAHQLGALPVVLAG